MTGRETDHDNAMEKLFSLNAAHSGLSREPPRCHVGPNISAHHSKELYSTKLRYETRASISFGDNWRAI